MKPSKTAVPFAPKMLSIFWRAASMLPPENTFFIASPAAVTAATILSKISRPLSPKIRPTASRTLSKFFRRSWTTVITAATTATIGSIFPAIPPIPPSRFFMPPSVVSDFPRFFNLPISPMLPACRIRNLLRSVSSTIFAVFTPRLISWKPSFRPSPPSFSAASAPTTFRTVCTNCGFAWANSEIFVTTPATLSATFPTIGKRFWPSTICRLFMLFLAFAILFSVVSDIMANALSVASLLFSIPSTLALNPSTPASRIFTAAVPASALPNISFMVFPLFCASVCRIFSTSARLDPFAIRSEKPPPATFRRILSAVLPLLPNSFSMELA